MTHETAFIEKTVGSFKAMDGTPIYYEVRGAGEPIVFIYGIACLMNHWHNQVEFFSKTHKVILFDIRGHHKSVPVNNTSNFTFDHLAFDLKGLPPCSRSTNITTTPEPKANQLQKDE